VQLFQNLISKAIKYSKEHPSNTNLGPARPRGFGNFAVADNGIGDRSARQELIFHILTCPRRRIVLLRHRGWPSAAGLSNANGGRIWVEASPGQGSTFFFSLPSRSGMSSQGIIESMPVSADTLRLHLDYSAWASKPHARRRFKTLPQKELTVISRPPTRPSRTHWRNAFAADRVRWAESGESARKFHPDAPGPSSATCSAKSGRLCNSAGSNGPRRLATRMSRRRFRTKI